MNHFNVWVTVIWSIGTILSIIFLYLKIYKTQGFFDYLFLFAFSPFIILLETIITIATHKWSFGGNKNMGRDLYQLHKELEELATQIQYETIMESIEDKKDLKNFKLLKGYKKDI